MSEEGRPSLIPSFFPVERFSTCRDRLQICPTLKRQIANLSYGEEQSIPSQPAAGLLIVGLLDGTGRLVLGRVLGHVRRLALLRSFLRQRPARRRFEQVRHCRVFTRLGFGSRDRPGLSFLIPSFGGGLLRDGSTRSGTVGSLAGWALGRGIASGVGATGAVGLVAGSASPSTTGTVSASSRQ